MMNKTILFLLSASIILFASCAKNSDMDDSSNPDNGVFKFKLDDNFVSRSDVVAIAHNDPNLTADIITIVSSTNEEITTNLSLFLTIGEGEMLEEIDYSFGEGCVTQVEGICGRAIYTKFAVDQFASYGTGGIFNISLSSIDHKVGGHISGTFHGTLVSVLDSTIVSLTEGEFNLPME